MLFPAALQAQRHHQRLAAHFFPIDQKGQKLPFIQLSSAQFLELRHKGRCELAAHAGFLNPIVVQQALHGALVVPCAQPRDDPFAHRVLPSPLVLQPLVVLQRNFLSCNGCAPVAESSLPSCHPTPHNPAAVPTHAAGFLRRLIARSEGQRHLLLNYSQLDSPADFARVPGGLRSM